MGLQLDNESEQLLAAPTDGVIVGVVDLPSQTLRLFRSGTASDPAKRVFCGHADLVRVGLVQPRDCLGFSIEVRDRKVRAFYRNSSLNKFDENFALSQGMMNRVLDAMGLHLSPDFRSYP